MGKEDNYMEETSLDFGFKDVGILFTGLILAIVMAVAYDVLVNGNTDTLHKALEVLSKTTLRPPIIWLNIL